MDRRSKAIDEYLKKLDLEVADLGTSFKVVTGRLENKLESTYQTLQVLASRQEKIEDAVLDLNKKYEKVVAFMAQISTDLRTNQKNKGMEESMGDLKFGSETYAPGASSMEASVISRGELMGNTRLPKIDFPHFGGKGPGEWLRKARKYFQLHQVPDELRVGVAKMYLRGNADIWFDGFIASHPGASWNLFSEELCKRFAETTGEEVVEIYNKSKQLGSIEEYQEKFDELKSKVLESMKTGSRGKGTVRKETKEALKPVDYRKLGKRKAVVEADKKPAMKRKAAKKDPNKPKRPPSAFFVFLEEFRKTFKKENPDVKGVAAVGKAGGEKWKSMSAAEKAPYEAKAAKKKAEYGSLVDGYNKKQESSADEGGKESERSKSEVHDEDDESVQEDEDDDGEEEDEEEEDDDDD